MMRIVESLNLMYQFSSAMFNDGKLHTCDRMAASRSGIMNLFLDSASGSNGRVTDLHRVFAISALR